MFPLNRVNLSYIMTHKSKKDYIEAVVNLSVVVISTGADRWRGPSSTPLLHPAETPHSNLQLHLKQ
jgi:hypothetical protein